MRKLLPLLLLLVPSEVFAQSLSNGSNSQYSGTAGGMTFAQFIGEIIGLINTMIPVLMSIGLLIFFIGLVRYVYYADNEKERRHGVDFIKWGLIALFVMLSLWGILDVAKTSIFNS